eukprot:2187013-Prymnesium_polylepis.1
MGKVLDNVLFCTADDEPRFREQLQALIAAGELREFRAFQASNTAAKKKGRKERAEKEAAEAEELARELGVGAHAAGGGGGMDALRGALAVRQKERQGAFDAMLGSLEQ